ncbi:diacylglycerol kinase family protein [Cytobacillus sp. IB215316]|uniref:diacylglycerol kinase family protein n=1 Tax=Cytobacillus sp. IB215316 TaxID=3097354 RepID=UPI002A12BE31|nr:diacylglycerol kinase family protein [Cytobacillus sp. IB215316]MDX8359550.1 diacylglycerol kinase family protein [Cytobacillus sp. IB215316]
MGYRDRNNNKFRNSLLFAINGIKHVASRERNFKIHINIAIVVLFLGLFVGLSPIEWVAIIITIGIMLSLEMINTAIERTVDLITTDYHPLAKLAKDISAGAVLLFAIISVMIGILIFLPKLILFL